MRNVLLSGLSGCLLGVVFCFPTLSFFAWVGLVPFLYTIKRASFQTGMLSSVVFAFCYYGLGMFWINHVTRLGFVALMFYISIYGVIFFLTARYFFDKPLGMLTISCVWVGVELLKERLWPYCGWLQLGFSQFQHLNLIQIADIGGVKLISWLIVMVNVFILEAISYLQTKQKSHRQQILFLGKTCAVVALTVFCLSYSFFRLRGLVSSDEIKVFLIQPNIPEHFKYNPVLSPLIVSSLRSLGSKATSGALAIYPEAAWPFIVDDSDKLKSLIEATRSDTLIGAVETKGGRYYNSALFFSKDGSLHNTYHKIKLVPYGEYMPLRRFLSFIDVINSIGDMSSGQEPVFFDYQGKIFSVLICFEDTFPELVRQAARGSDFLVNITNDGWFYGEPEASQHLAVMTFRAVENRITIIRSANTGISGWVSFTGAGVSMIRQRSKVFFCGAETFNIALNQQRSVYTRYGDFFSFSCLVFLGLFFVVDMFSKKISMIQWSQ